MLKKYLNKLINPTLKKINLKNKLILLSTLFFFCQSTFLSANEDPELTEVYNKLKEYKTDSRLAPNLSIDASVKVAAYNKEKESILINPDIIRFVETKYGEYEKEIFALLIGHELAHFYNGHGWVHEISNHTPNIKENEIIADRHAIYYSYLAGYDTSIIPDDFLKDLYQWIPSNSKDYPSLDERRNIFKQAENEVQEAIHRFEMANLLYLMKEYELAIFAYENIAKEFPTKEVLNNISAACLKSALDKFDPIDELKGMLYPIEFDNEITLKKIKIKRTRAASRSITAAEKILRNDLLEKAEKYIDATIRIDKSYTVAHLNSATLYNLKAIHETGELSYFMNKAKAKINDYEYQIKKKYNKENQQKNLQSSKILNAIIDYQLGNEDQAIDIFLSIEKLGLAEYNLYFINHKTVKGSHLKNKQCAGKRLADYNLYKNDDIIKLEELALEGGFLVVDKDKDNHFQISHFIQKKEAVELLFFEIEKDGITYKIWAVKTLPKFIGKTCHEIGLNENIETLIENAGEVTFDNIHTSRKYTYYSYVHQGSFIYRLNDENKVDEIIYFHSNKKDR